MSIKVFKTFLLFVFLNLCVSQVFAEDTPRITFTVKALFKDRVMLEINGVQRFLSAGDVSPEGIKLVSSDAHQANIVCHDQDFMLYINQSAYVGTVDVEPSAYSIPNKIVPGDTVAFNKGGSNDIIKYTLKIEHGNPVVMEDGQDAIWIGMQNKLLRFDVKKEAWGVFPLEKENVGRIDKLSVSDKSVIFRRGSNLSLFDTRNRNFYIQLHRAPSSHQFIDETLWFVDTEKGLGKVKPENRNKPNTSYADALLYKEKPKDKNKPIDKDKPKSGSKKPKVKNENAMMMAANGDDIWYSHYSNYKQAEKKKRLNEVCVSRYNKKRKTFIRYTREEMGLDNKINCIYLAVGEDQVWVGHDNKRDGLSVFDTSTSRWKQITESTNEMLIGGGKIVLDNGKLIMLVDNQLIALDTETLYADVLLGNATIENPRQSVIHAYDGYAWLSVLESVYKHSRSFYSLVLYKIPI